MKRCTVITPDGPCPRPFHGKGMCRTHFDRTNRYGDPRAHIPIGKRRRKQATATTWMADAACAHHPDDLWFPTRGAQEEDLALAYAICDTCPVRDECLAYALDQNITFGVWGGKSGAERRALRRAS